LNRSLIGSPINSRKPMSKPRYATVPITLLKNIHKDQGGTIRQMFDYAIYDRMVKEFPDMDEDDLDIELVGMSMDYFRLNHNRLESRLQDGKEIYHNHKTDPNASISIELLLKFQDEKTEFELMVFSFYCAIRSMIGTSPYWKGTDDFWTARAFGCPTMEDYQNEVLTQQQKDMRVKYSNQYWLDKIKLTLQNDWNLIYVSTNKYMKVRGFYVSMKMSYEQLVLIAKEKNEKYKSKKILREEVLARVFG
jgi:hypothetical protein